MSMVALALWGWIPVCLALFAMLPPRRALLVGLLGGWLFLPVAGFAFRGLPEYDKSTAVACGVLLGALVFDTDRLARGFRTRWFDLVVLLVVVSPFFSAFSNRIGGSLFGSFYGGLSMAVEEVVRWGIPYLLGRIYFNRAKDLRELAVAIVIAGLVYVPLCLLESRLSPQLHRWVYGFHARSSFQQTKRLGGFRPTVFLGHGLAVGLFMTTATLVAMWMWLAGAMRRVWVLPMAVVSAGLFATTLLCRSSGAIVLTVGGGAILLMMRLIRTRIWLAILIAMPVLYMVVRIAGIWSGEGALEVAAFVFGEQRAGSLAGRMANEDLFTDKAMLRPIFGWSGWNRFQVFDDYGRQLTTPDGLWVIVLGQKGLTGLVSLVAMLLLPAIELVRRVPARRWGMPVYAAPVALSVVLTLFMVDCLLNAFLNPVYPLAVGGLLPFLAADAARSDSGPGRPVPKRVQ